jgi:hypothetical protein
MMNRMKREDPRAIVVDDLLEIPAGVAAKHDVLQGLRYYFGEIYYNDHFSLDFRDAHPATLIALARQHAGCFNEAQALMEQCVLGGIDFDSKQINNFRDFHIKKARTLSDLAASKIEAKMKEGESDDPPPSDDD